MKNSARDESTVPYRILLVDDNKHGLVARKRVLEEQGYAIETAASGEEGVDRFSGQPFDLVVTDFKMQKMTGVELIQAIRALKPSIPTILLSGFVEPLGLTEESTGADAVLSKSAGEVGQLVRTVRSLLRRNIAKKPPGSQTHSKTASIAR
jgi:CheY-like chemotaxis protein